MENPPLAEGDFINKCSTIGKNMETFLIDKISPDPSLLKKGIKRTGC
jgi:hypothetical protein